MYECGTNPLALTWALLFIFAVLVGAAVAVMYLRPDRPVPKDKP